MTSVDVALPCPDCRAPLTDAARCPSCALPLTGPLAQRLWEVDVALTDLAGRQETLRAERAGLLVRLREMAPASDSAGPWDPAPAQAELTGAGAGQRSVLPEASPRSVQNVLLTLGALLLAVAATVFAAVTYDRLGAGGRAVVLLTLTAAAAGAAPVLLRRRLSASAETAAAVTLALAALDAYGLRTLGLGRGLEPSTYAAASAAVLAGLCLLYARPVPVRLAAVAALALGHVSALFLLDAGNAGAGMAGVALVAVAAADLLLLQAPLPPHLRTWTSALALTSAGAGLLAAGLGVALGDDLAAGALLLLGGVSAAAATRTTDPRLRELLSAAPVPLVGAAAWALLRTELTDVQEPLVAAGTGLLAALIAGGLPVSWRRGPLLAALGVTGLAVLSQAEAVVQALVLPTGWLARPWTRSADSARAALAPDAAWSGTVVTLLVVAAAVAVVLTAAAALHRFRAGLLVAALPALAGVILLPLGLATSYAVALAQLLVVAAALLGAGLAPSRLLSGWHHREVPLRSALLAGAGAVTLYACVWSAADRTACLVVLPLATALAVVATSRPGRTAAPATALAGLLLGATVAAHGAGQGLAGEQVGGLLVAVVAVLGGVTLVRPLAPTGRAGIELAAALLAVVALLLAGADPGWLSWSLAGLGLVCLGGAVRAERRSLAAPAGALLLAASSWVRLAEAGVQAPEPYVVPLGLLALLLGHLRRRSAPATGSVPAYGPGLSALLVPSLLAALGDDRLARPMLLGLVALAVLLVGVRTRLRAPLAFGGAVLAVDALHLLMPYAATLPRWLPLALAGALLVGLGATYEQRRRDLGRLRERLSALT